MRWTLNDKYDIIDDVLRIEQKCKTIQDDLNHLLGQSINLNIKLDWTRSDIPTINNMERIRSNLQTLINYITIFNIPTFGNTFLYTDANNFEEAIEILEDFVRHQSLEDKPMAGYYCANEPVKLMAERS